jgi:phage recombination protein Bet
VNTDLTVHEGGSALAITPEQTDWNPKQLATLQHIGVAEATPGDLAVFFHVAQRTGLDPFARQIYMIGRWSRDGVKWTIQTGIDGFRLIGRRAADRARHTVSVGAPEWAKEDGAWRPLWVPAWGPPLAARVTILRDGQPFTAVALFDEYKQTKRDGGLTQMWAQRPAGQIAKCAEALAWRMAFPQDLAGLYVDDEMHQADTRTEPDRPASQRVTAADILEGSAEEQGADPEPALGDEQRTEDIPTTPITDKQRKHLHALVNELGLTRDQKIAGLRNVTGRPVESSNDLTEGEAAWAITALQAKIDARAAETEAEAGA